jgi:hypothetical protein
MKAGRFDDNVISVEDSQTGYTFHFAVGKTKGFRYLGVQTDPPQSTPPAISSTALAAADTVARNFAKANGWL